LAVYCWSDSSGTSSSKFCSPKRNKERDNTVNLINYLPPWESRRLALTLTRLLQGFLGKKRLKSSCRTLANFFNILQFFLPSLDFFCSFSNSSLVVRFSSIRILSVFSSVKIIIYKWHDMSESEVPRVNIEPICSCHLGQEGSDLAAGERANMPAPWGRVSLEPIWECSECFRISIFSENKENCLNFIQFEYKKCWEVLTGWK